MDRRDVVYIVGGLCVIYAGLIVIIYRDSHRSDALKTRAELPSGWKWIEFVLPTWGYVIVGVLIVICGVAVVIHTLLSAYLL